MGYRILAEATMVVHFAYLAFVVAGGFLAWRWPRTFWLHAAATAWGFATILMGLNCPLTYVEDRSRERAGQPGLPPDGFIDHYLEGVLYPDWSTPLIRWLVATTIAIAWLGVLVRWRPPRIIPRRH
ncbi:DUF2784 domain-containing protein [Actinomycetes bacterium KLBMP 9797]